MRFDEVNDEPRDGTTGIEGVDKDGHLKVEYSGEGEQRIMSMNDVYTWGFGGHGQLRFGTVSYPRTVPYRPRGEFLSLLR